MRREAEAHAEEDQRRRDLIEARNTADNAIYSSEKTLRDLGDKVPADIKASVEAAVEKVRSVREHDAPAEINREVEALMQTLQKVGQAAYSQQPPQDENPQSGPVKPLLTRTWSTEILPRHNP
jgi:molecular chaperone DnaK